MLSPRLFPLFNPFQLTARSYAASWKRVVIREVAYQRTSLCAGSMPHSVLPAPRAPDPEPTNPDLVLPVPDHCNQSLYNPPPPPSVFFFSSEWREKSKQTKVCKKIETKENVARSRLDLVNATDQCQGQYILGRIIFYRSIFF